MASGASTPTAAADATGTEPGDTVSGSGAVSAVDAVMAARRRRRIKSGASTGSSAGSMSGAGVVSDTSVMSPLVESGSEPASRRASVLGGEAAEAQNNARDVDEDGKPLSARERAKRKVAEFRRQMEEKARAQLGRR